MSNLYRIIIMLLVISMTACTTSQSNLWVASGEDDDSGLGGTGLLANANNSGDSGLGGTGILGEITGYGSIFVNGIEIEYDSETAFTVNGDTAGYQQLEIGDVVEVHTTDLKKHTQAQIINLRHEVIGKVESIDPQAFSFTVQGQTVIQPVNKEQLPLVGDSVAVSGFRVNDNTIVSTRVTPAGGKSILLRTHTELPFKQKTTHWLVQLHVKNDKAVFQVEGRTQVLSIKKEAKIASTDRSGTRILQLQKAATGQLKLEQVIEPMAMPRGQQVPTSVRQSGGNKSQKQMPGSGRGGYSRQGRRGMNTQPGKRGK